MPTLEEWKVFKDEYWWRFEAGVRMALWIFVSLFFLSTIVAAIFFCKVTFIIFCILGLGSWATAGILFVAECERIQEEEAKNSQMPDYIRNYADPLARIRPDAQKRP